MILRILVFAAFAAEQVSMSKKLFALLSPDFSNSKRKFEKPV